MADLYRKTAMEKVSRPEHRDRRIAVSSVFFWLALLGAAIVVASVILWMAFGTVPVTETARGVLEDRLAVCSVPAERATQIKKGMTVRVYPETADMQKHGHMEATVLSVEPYPASEEVLSEGASVSVLCRLRTDRDSKNGFYWTKESGRSLSLPERTPVRAEIFLRSETPFASLFGFGAEEEPAS